MPEADIREVYTLVDLDTGEAQTFEDDKSDAYERWMDWTEDSVPHQNAMFIKAELPEPEEEDEEEEGGESPPEGDRLLILGLRVNGYIVSSGDRATEGEVIPTPPEIDFHNPEEE